MYLSLSLSFREEVETPVSSLSPGMRRFVISGFNPGMAHGCH